MDGQTDFPHASCLGAQLLSKALSPEATFAPEDVLGEHRPQTHIDWVLGYISHNNCGVTLPLLCQGRKRMSLGVQAQPLLHQTQESRPPALLPQTRESRPQPLLPQTQQSWAPDPPPSEPGAWAHSPSGPQAQEPEQQPFWSSPPSSLTNSSPCSSLQ